MNTTPLSTEQIVAEERRLLKAHRQSWLDRNCCPECHRKLEYRLPRAGFFKKLLGLDPLDSEAHCKCGTRVVDLETHHWWDTFKVTPSLGAPYTINSGI